MMQFRLTILTMCAILTSSTLAAQAAHTSNPSTLSTDSAALRIALMHEQTLDLVKLAWSDSDIIQSWAEIGRLHQIMNDLLKEQGWSFEEAISLQGQNGKKADLIHQRQARLLQRRAPRRWRKSSGRETTLECCVVLSFYHEFQTPDGGHEHERIALKAPIPEWAQIVEERIKKSRRRGVVFAGASVAMVGVVIAYWPYFFLIFGGHFVS